MSDHESAFIGERELLEKFYKQLKDFELWNEQRDWLAFHNHHYDWWAFPSSSNREENSLSEKEKFDLFQLTRSAVAIMNSL